MSHRVIRALVLLLPWVLSAVIVCSLWLGFSQVQPVPEMCMYGISKDANTASTWLTVFIPAIVIIILLIFLFIAAMGEMPAQSYIPYNNGNQANSCPRSRSRSNGDRDENLMPNSTNSARNVENVTEIGGVVYQRTMTSWSSATLLSRHHRRFIAALLVVDFISLVLSLPFPAFTHVGPSCTDHQSCQSLRSLFQTLSWMRSSVVCVRPLFFMILTDIRQSFVKRTHMRRNSEIRTTTAISMTEESRGEPRERQSSCRAEMLHMKHFSEKQANGNECTSSTIAVTPPNSPLVLKGRPEEVEVNTQNEETVAFV